MKFYRILVMTTVLVCTLALAESSPAQYNYIDIDNPFLRKIPMAVPVFTDLDDSKTDNQTLQDGSDLLIKSLDFTGYFKIIDRGAYLIDPQKPAVAVEEINFNNWVSIGAELLITGGVTVNGDQIEMELRLFDTFKAKQLVGKKYQGLKSNQRQIIHRFCSEVIYHLTGTRGIFGSRIAFVSTGTGNKEIYLSDFDGHQPEQFTNNGTINMSPDWSSDGEWLAYTSYKEGRPDIYITSFKTKEQYRIAKERLNITPAWVPGRFALAATLSFSGDQEIYLLTGKGKIIKRLTSNWGSDVSPTWSPDGKKVAFVSNRSGSPQIYVKDLSSGRVNRLTFMGNYNTQPHWSPNGDRIAYTSLAEGRNHIYIIDLEGLNPIQLTHDSGNNESPSWSPDGSLIVFSSTREGRARLYVMTAFGTDQRRLLMMPGEQTNPRWSPNFMEK